MLLFVNHIRKHLIFSVFRCMAVNQQLSFISRRKSEPVGKMSQVTSAGKYYLAIILSNMWKLRVKSNIQSKIEQYTRQKLMHYKQ